MKLADYTRRVTHEFKDKRVIEKTIPFYKNCRKQDLKAMANQ